MTAVGSDVADARAKAYEGVARISFPGAQCRHDIAPADRPLVAATSGPGDADHRADEGPWETSPVTVPNVLATRYAGDDLAAIWSPEHKIVLERRLWIAVLEAQRDLGVDVPDGVVEAYETSSTRSTSTRSPRASGSPATT